MLQSPKQFLKRVLGMIGYHMGAAFAQEHLPPQAKERFAAGELVIMDPELP